MGTMVPLPVGEEGATLPLPGNTCIGIAWKEIPQHFEGPDTAFCGKALTFRGTCH